MPIANITNFSATPVTGESPLTVSFTDLSSPTPSSWLWDFGDGNTSTVQNPTHVYSSPGTYSVTLTPNDPFGAYTQTDYITVSSNHGAYVVKTQSGNIKFLSTDPGTDVNVDVTGTMSVSHRISVGGNDTSIGSITSSGDMSITPSGRLSLAGVYWPDGSVEPVTGMYLGVSTANELQFYVLPNPPTPSTSLTINEQSGDYTLQISDASNVYIKMINSSSATVTIPNDISADLPVGSAILIGWSGIGSVSIAGEPGVIVNTPETFDIGKRYGKITAIKVAANTWEIEGNLAPVL